MDEFRKKVQPLSEAAMADKLEALTQQIAKEASLGATGAFPEGKLTQQDEGEIKIAVTVTDGKVVLAFGKPVAWIGFSPRQARQIAELLRQRSYQAAEAPEPDART